MEEEKEKAFLRASDKKEERVSGDSEALKNIPSEKADVIR